jgi:hypothetical protein
MTVKDLIAKLAQYPEDWDVKSDYDMEIEIVEYGEGTVTICLKTITVGFNEEDIVNIVFGVETDDWGAFARAHKAEIDEWVKNHSEWIREAARHEMVEYAEFNRVHGYEGWDDDGDDD